MQTALRVSGRGVFLLVILSLAVCQSFAAVTPEGSCEGEVLVDCSKKKIMIGGQEVGTASCGEGEGQSSLTRNEPNAKVGQDHDASTGGGKVTVGIKIAGQNNAPGKVIHTMSPHSCSNAEPPNNKNISQGCVVVTCQVLKKVAACKGKPLKIQGASNQKDKGGGQEARGGNGMA